MNDTLMKLTGVAMICLQGFGLGSTRVSELFRIEQHQLCWKIGCLYYVTISNKRRSSSLSCKKTVEHKLPACISRYLLLYDYIGREFYEGREFFIFNNNNDTADGNHVNNHFYEDYFERMECFTEFALPFSTSSKLFDIAVNKW